jgi:DNA-binding GntR family transcriptional regulator
VVQRLQEAITQGHLVPGQKLVYSEIADEMNVSVTPVREAVKTLEALGLVTIRPHRTAFVSYLTEDQVEQLYALRTLLEGLATQRTVERITPGELSHLTEVYGEMDRVVETLNRVINDVVRSEGIVSLQHLHNDFHSSLYASCGNEYLIQTIGLLRSQVATYWPVINRYSIERVNKSHRQHYDILTACEQKQSMLASELMQSHLQATVPWIIEHIRTDHRQNGVSSGTRVRGATTGHKRYLRQQGRGVGAGNE